MKVKRVIRRMLGIILLDEEFENSIKGEPAIQENSSLECVQSKLQRKRAASELSLRIRIARAYCGGHNTFFNSSQSSTGDVLLFL
jgi:hypothetical protein